MDALKGLKRAPKWTWYIVAGIGLGGVAITILKGRQAKTDAAPITDGTDPGVGLNPSPQPGIVVPPVIIPSDSSDPMAGVLPLQELYISSIGQVVAGWQDVANGWQQVYTPVLNQLGSQNDQLIGLLGGSVQQNNQIIGAIAQAGPAPQAVQTPLQLPPPPPPPAPAAASRTHTKDNGLHGSARRVWCMCGDHKVAEGACWAEGSVCT